jgi:surfeit locus 1 family protein
VTPATRRLIGPGLMTIAMLAVLIGLGTWQVQRLQWKRAILASIAQAEASPPIPLTNAPEPYTKVVATGTLRDDLSALYGAEVRDTRSGPELGGELIVPLERDGQPPLLVDRGWVPNARRSPLTQPQGQVSIIGYVRPADQKSWFSAKDDVPGRQFFTLNPAAIAHALQLPAIAPFTLVALGEALPDRWPAPAQHLPQPPNNHLSYAITWYGLAVALVVIFILWARKAVDR